MLNPAIKRHNRPLYWALPTAAGLLLVLANALSFGLGAVYLLLVCLGLAWLAVVFTDWRWAIWGLILFMPFIGVLEIPTYPSTTAAVLAKDALFVVPLYLSLGHRLLVGREQLQGYGLPSLLLVLFAALAVVGLLNPGLISSTVGLIGLKIWLMYIPIAYIATIFVDSRTRLLALLRAIAYVSAIPAAIGLLEVMMLHSGHAELVYRLYGQAAHAMFFGASESGTLVFRDSLGNGGFLALIPSTMEAPAQFALLLYGGLAAAMAVFALERQRRRAAIALGILAIDSIAALTTGERSVFVFVPILLVATAVTSGQLKVLATWLPALSGGIWAALLLLGGGAAAVYSVVSNLFVLYGGQSQGSILSALGQTFLGFGPGMDTNQAWRYTSQTTTLSWAESWFAQTVLELGWPGLVLASAIWATILMRGWKNLGSTTNRSLRTVQLCCFWYIIIMLLQSIKASPLNIDPTNVQMWLFAGVMLRAGSLSEVREGPMTC